MSPNNTVSYPGRCETVAKINEAISHSNFRTQDILYTYMYTEQFNKIIHIFSFLKNWDV